MKTDARVYELLGVLLSYPGDDYLAAAEECVQLLDAAGSPLEHAMDRFVDRLRPLTTSELQELFTVTFDLNPVCSLEVGWHLHGDAYDRGEFLVTMRQLLRRVGVEEGNELPDHLAHLLTALPRLDREEANALVATALLPAAEKMLPALAAKHNPFEHLLTAVLALLNDEVWPQARAASAPAAEA